MYEDQKNILEQFVEKNKRRSDFVWSKSSIIGYLWDIVINIIVVFVVLGIYSTIYSSSDIIIVSILILIYLRIVSVVPGLGQSMLRTRLINYWQTAEILKKLGKEDREEDRSGVEELEFLLEKAEYKYYISSIFNFIIFIIVILNFFGIY